MSLRRTLSLWICPLLILAAITTTLAGGPAGKRHVYKTLGDRERRCT